METSEKTTTPAEAYKEGAQIAFNHCINVMKDTQRIYTEENCKKVFRQIGMGGTTPAQREVMVMAVSTVMSDALKAIQESFEKSLADIMAMEVGKNE